MRAPRGHRFREVPAGILLDGCDDGIGSRRVEGLWSRVGRAGRGRYDSAIDLPEEQRMPTDTQTTVEPAAESTDASAATDESVLVDVELLVVDV